MKRPPKPPTVTVLVKLLVVCLVPAVGGCVLGALAVGGSSAIVYGVDVGVILGMLAAAFGLFLARHA
jgi:hypothetical protein